MLNLRVESDSSVPHGPSIISYPRPSNESQRLRALREYEILDTPADQAYDDYTFLTSMICDVPIATVSLVDAERQWFKSCIGIDARETPRDIAFCAHTIMGDQVMVVQDASRDKRFANNPLVTSDPNIRFYAGAPLITPQGYGIGALCAIDNKPHALHAAQEQALKSLARQLMAQLELLRVSRALAKSLEMIKTIEGLVPICSYCKSIRDDQGFWASLEEYLDDHADAELTHGICETCMEKHFPEHMDPAEQPAKG